MIRSVKRLFTAIAITACVTVMLAAPAWSGPLRIGMTDGTFVEVPYYWELDGQLKFDIPGGVIGVPASQVASVTEVLESREFDPEAMTQGSGDSDRDLLQNINDSRTGRKVEAANPRVAESMKAGATSPAEKGRPPIELVRGQSFKIAKSLPAVSSEPGGPAVVVQDILSSKTDLKNRTFTLVLYNVEGNVILSRPCEVYPLHLDQENEKKLDLHGKLFLVRAAIKLDPKVKRYEITVAGR